MGFHTSGMAYVPNVMGYPTGGFAPTGYQTPPASMAVSQGGMAGPSGSRLLYQAHFRDHEHRYNNNNNNNL